MQTTFTDEQLQDPGVARSNEILRACVHCGFCTATCPTYQVLGDELDSPRGRIYLIKDMLEAGRPADARTVKHIDRCLGCLACMTTCPSGVHYMHLVDHARDHIEKTYRRPLDTDINDATIRLLRRMGCEVVIPKGMGCCGALTHHMGRAEQSHGLAATNIRAWMAEKRARGLDAIVINTSGCGTTIKDYGHIFRNDPLAAEAAEVSALALDVTELLERLGLPEGAPKGLRVAYHSACSLQHGQRIRQAPKELLARAGFEVTEPADPHLCCGSAGTYNLLHPEISAELKARKVATLEARKPDVVSAGNIGCIMQIGSGMGVPVVHTVELLDWATGGPKPRRLELGNDPP